jgi:hypothetical protein
MVGRRSANLVVADVRAGITALAAKRGLTAQPVAFWIESAFDPLQSLGPLMVPPDFAQRQMN